MNNVNLIGRLTRDPETRYTPDGLAIARFSIAIDRPAKSGEEKKADFPNIVVFGKQAENCERYLEKGRQVGITGRIQTGSYEKQDGSKAYTTDVIAERVEFIGGGNKTQENAKEGATMGIPDGFAVIEDEDMPF